MELITSKLFLITLTIGVYLLAEKFYRKYTYGCFNPIIVSIVVICCFLLYFEIDYVDYKVQTNYITFLLGPSVVALGYKLYEQYDCIKTNLFPILLAVTFGSFISIVSIIVLGNWLNINPEIVASLQPKSVTTPIALSISQQLHGIPAITVVVVIGVGILGAVMGPTILKKAGITTPVATGLALGATAHGLGTARAFELGTLQGAISGMAIGLMGIITAVMVPIVNYLMY